MALWQIMKKSEPTGELFDDGSTARPGDEAFSTAAVAAYVATLGGNGDGFNFVGVPDAPPEEA